MQVNPSSRNLITGCSWQWLQGPYHYNFWWHRVILSTKVVFLLNFMLCWLNSTAWFWSFVYHLKTSTICWNFSFANEWFEFWWQDTDVMWLRNPFSRLGIYNESVDLQISTDWFNGDPHSEKNAINTGFYYIRSNNKTISLFDAWYGRKDNSTGKKEQDVLFDIMKAGMFGQLGLQARFLDTVYFSGFCTDSKDINAVITVHANCCRSINAKVKDLTAVLRDWKKFKATTAKAAAVHSNITVPFSWTGHFGCWESWKTKV